MAGVKDQDNTESSRSKLRSEAEKKVARSTGKSAPLKKQDLDKLVHELRVHQVELEMQNEELRGAQEQIAKSRNDYADLYDFSPVGYFTFNGDALITGVNLTGAALLGVERQKLLKRRFRQFVAPADAELWDRHFVSVLQQGEKQSCDLLLRRNDGSTLHARLDSIRVEMDDGTFVVRTGISDITERKRAEKAQERAQRLLSETEKIGRVGGWEFNIDTGKQNWTEEVYHIHELDTTFDPTVEEGINFYAPASRPIIEGAVKRAIAHGESFDVELEIITAKGNLRNIHAIGKADLENRRVYGFFQDITDRKYAEQALKESEEINRRLADYYKRLNDISITFGKAVDTGDLFNKIAESFRLITDAVASSFAFYDQEARALKVMSLSIDPISRDNVLSILGSDLFKMQIPVSTDDIKQMLTQSIRRPEDLHELSSGQLPRDISDSVMDAIGCRQIVALAISHDGEIMGTCIAYLRGDQPVVPDEALKTYISLSALAIKRKQAEEALQESEEKYHTIADFTRDWEYWMSPEGSFLYVSPSCKFHTGYEPEAFQQDPDMMLKVVHPDDRDNYACHQKEALASDERSNPLDFRIITRDGEKRWIGHRCQKVYSGDGQFIGIRGSNRDITDRKAAEQAVLERVKELACLYNISSLAEIQDISLDELLKRTSMLIPQGYRFTEVAEACIVLEGQDFPTVRFHETPWVLAGKITVAGKTVGQVKVCYLEERPASDEGPFLKEERHLIDAVASQLGKIISRMRTEDELKESEEKYRILFVNAIEGIGVAQDGRFKMVNPKLVELLGYSEEEVLSLSLAQFIYPEDGEFVIERNMKRLKGEIFENAYQFRAVNKSGDTRWVEINTVLIEWEDRPATLDYYTDITERREAAILVEKQRQEYRTIFDSVRPMIAYLNEEGVIQRINKSGADTFGLEPKEIVGKTMYDFFPAAEADKFAAENDQVITSGEPILGSIVEYTLPSGLKRWAQIDRIPYFDQHGDVIGVITFNQDITRRKLAEDNLEESYQNLKKTLTDAINTMAKIVETRDPYTAGHQQKVAVLATAIASEMKLEDTQIDQLRMAAVIHDIGKMYVPSDILSRPGKLSNMEFALIRTHAQSGYDIIEGMDFPCNIAKAVLQHHERLDGSGYPNQLKGEDTLLEAKILSVADVVEAMASHRPYRAALGIDKALEEISKNRGRLYDPEVVDACLEVFNSGKFEFKAV